MCIRDNLHVSPRSNFSTDIVSYCIIEGGRIIYEILYEIPEYFF